MKLRANASTEVMLRNALRIWMMPNLSHPPHRREWPNQQSWTCVNSGDSQAIWEQGHVETPVCPQQLGSVSGFSVLGKTNGGVRHSFYAFRHIGRKSSYGPIPLNSVVKSLRCSGFVIKLQVFLHFYHETYFFQECVELVLHIVHCLGCLSHQPPVLLLAFLFMCCYFSVCTQHLSAVYPSHSHPANPSHFSAPKGIFWIVLAIPCALLCSSFFCFSYS